MSTRAIASAFDGLDDDAAAALLARCCGSRTWVRGMLARRPFADDDALLSAADTVWSAIEPDDVREALAHHPALGEDLAVLRERFANTASWSSSEQAGVGAADEVTLLALRDGNRRYRERFGFTFVMCATGRSAAEMLAALQGRIDNPPARELDVAALEQAAITRLRLHKLAAGPAA